MTNLEIWLVLALMYTIFILVPSAVKNAEYEGYFVVVVGTAIALVLWPIGLLVALVKRFNKILGVKYD